MVKNLLLVGVGFAVAHKMGLFDRLASAVSPTAPAPRYVPAPEAYGVNPHGGAGSLAAQPSTAQQVGEWVGVGVGAVKSILGMFSQPSSNSGTDWTGAFNTDQGGGWNMTTSGEALPDGWVDPWASA